MAIKLGVESVRSGFTLPKKSTSGAAAFDAYLPETYPPINPGEIRIVPLGFKVSMPEGYKLEVCARSGLASKGIIVANGVGIVDSDFSHEVGVILWNASGMIQPLNKGDRICQLALEKVIDFTWEETNVAEIIERGKGFGSSGGHESVEGVKP